MNMTALACSTGSTTEPQPPPDRGEWPGSRRAVASARPSLAAIVTSLHARTGKTLLARVLADYFVLAGSRPLVFDTDATEHALHGWFPDDTVVTDLGEVRDQMALFDTLAARAPEARVVDVSHHVYRKFFRLIADCHFIAEARTRQVEPVIFYIADRNPDAYEEGRILRERFEECALVLVENEFIGPVKDITRRSAGYRAFETHDLCVTLPTLDRAVMDLIEESNVSLSELMSKPLSRSDDTRSAGLTFEQRAEVRGWLVQVFRALHQVIRAVERRAPAPI
jgi:hypothetical protein